MIIGNNGVVSEEEYLANRSAIQRAQALVDSAEAANEEARRRFQERDALLQKIEEGKRAEALLQAMMSGANGGSSRRPLAIAGPPMQQQVASAPTQKSKSPMISKIVEVPDHSASSVGGVQSPASQPYSAQEHPTASLAQHGYPPMVLPGQQPATITMWHSQAPGTRLPPNSQKARPRQTTAGRTQSRPALSMQPIGSGQPANHAIPQHQGNLGSGQRPTPIQQPVIQHAASTHNVISTSTPSGPSVPNVVANPYFATHLTPSSFKPPTSSSSSSLAGALGQQGARGSSNLPQSTSAQPTSQLTPLGAAVSNLQEQLTLPGASASSSSSQSASVKNVTPNMAPGTSSGTEVNAARTTHKSPPGHFLERIEQIAADFFSGLDWKRVTPDIEFWSYTAPPDTMFPLKNSLHVYKDHYHRLYLGVPIPQSNGNFIRVPIPSSAARPLSQMNNDRAEPLPPPLTAEQQKKYHPYSIPPHPALSRSYHPTQAIQSSSMAPFDKQLHATTSVQPTRDPPIVTPANHGVVTPEPGKIYPEMTPSHETPLLAAPATNKTRSPAQADKRRIARDILRALNPKRPRPEDDSISGLSEPPAKRHEFQSSTFVSSVPQASNHSVPTSTLESGRSPTSIAPSRSSQLTLPTKDVVVSQSSLDKSSETQGRSTITLTSTPDPSHNSNQNESLPAPPQEIPPTATDHPPLKHQVSSEGTGPSYHPTPPSWSISAAQPGFRVPTDVPRPSSNLSDLTPRSDRSKEKMPLFLPSPSQSPTANASDGYPGKADRLAKRDPVKKSQPFYIWVPPPPDYVKKYKAQQLKALRRKNVDEPDGGSESRPSSSKLLEDDVLDLDPTSNGFVDGESERQAVLLSCSRLCVHSCKWNGCGAVLSSAEKLIAHFACAHNPKDRRRNLFTCLWQHCGKREITASRLFYHLRTHAISPLICAYEGCDESFRTARPLAKHFRVEHLNDPEKPSAPLLTPHLITPPPIPSGSIPWYLVEPVQQPSISRDRHSILGPSVLLKIAGPVKRTKRYNAAIKLSRSGSEGDELRRLDTDPYDFLTFPSTNFSTAPSQPARIRDMEDLQSEEVSKFANQNAMLLWDDSDSEDPDQVDDACDTSVLGETVDQLQGDT